MFSKLYVGYRLGLVMDVVLLSNQLGDPKGRLETLAVEVLGLAPELLASPWRPLCIFLLFCYAK